MGQNKNYTLPVRTQGTGGLSVKQNWGSESRECCEPPDACPLKVGGARQQAPNRSHLGASLLIVGGSGDRLRSVSQACPSHDLFRFDPVRGDLPLVIWTIHGECRHYPLLPQPP